MPRQEVTSHPAVAVVGAGTMGVGIAYVFAAAGCRTTVVEPDPDGVTRLHEIVLAQSRQGVVRGKLTESQAEELPSLVTAVRSADELDRGLDLVIESVPERLELKLDVLAELQKVEPALLATNTSALSIDEMSRHLERPESFLGMHFFNPVWSLPMVELVRGTATSPHAVEAAQRLVRLIGKESIVVRDVPGFATSRLDLVAALEAMRMLETKVASADDIDKAMVLAYRHPVGPLRLSDIVGLDVRLDIARHLNGVYGERFAVPQILIDKVAAGHLGAKSGQGFFTWPTHQS